MHLISSKHLFHLSNQDLKLTNQKIIYPNFDEKEELILIFVYLNNIEFIQ